VMHSHSRNNLCHPLISVICKMTQGWTRTAKLRQYTRKIPTVAPNLSQFFSFASTEFGRLSGRKIRTCRGNLPYDMWDNTASDMLPPTLPAASPAPIPVSQMKSKRFLSSPIGVYQDSISEHASLNPRGEAWTMPADPLPYRDPVHKGPASGACQLYDHLKPLSDFDNRDRVRNHGWNEHNQHRSFNKRLSVIKGRPWSM